MEDPMRGAGDPGPKPEAWRLGRVLLIALGVGLALFLLIQLVPVGRDHSAPPVSAEPAWPDAQTKDLARSACFDCHSNETVWPWYSNVAPISWLVSRDVEDGRARLNFSEWNRPQPELREVVEAIQEGGMPPNYYTAIHGSAKLTDQEKAMLTAGMDQMWATSPPGQGG